MTSPTDNDALMDVLADIWRQLARAVSDSRDPKRTSALATADDAGSHARTVVLRDADEPARALIAYTDARSAKFRQIAANPRVSWLFYDPGQPVQVRLEGAAALHTDDVLADTQWRQASDGNRRLYAGPTPGGPPDAPPADDPRENFAVIRCIIDRVDWLDLSVPGHRRARFDWHAGQWQARWVAP